MPVILPVEEAPDIADKSVIADTLPSNPLNPFDCTLNRLSKGVRYWFPELAD